MKSEYSKLRMIYVLLIASHLLGQEYKIQFSHTPFGQGVVQNDSIGLMNSIGGLASKDIESDSYSISPGFLNTIQGVFSEPPVISDFAFPKNIKKNGDPIIISATITDLNGINNAILYLQIGGSDNQISLPMSNMGNNLYEVSVHDSLISLQNFRAKILSIDNMESSTTTDYQFTDIQFNNKELSMIGDFSHYPNGIKKGEWKLVSWPAQPANNSLALSSLDEGHVFYDWDPTKESYSIATKIEIGNAYWFKHKYKEPVIFQEDTSVAIPLENYVIDLKEGWNLIGSPFSFPVQFEKDSIVNDPITYGISDKANGWASSQSLFSPWNGYAVFTPERATITLLPFPEEDNLLNSIILSNEWYLNILLENETFINYASEIGRRKNADDYYDYYDTPIYPEINKSISLVMDLSGSTPFEYIRDIRDIEEQNGVWNLRLNGDLNKKTILMSGKLKGSIPEGLVIALIDIAEREISYELLNPGIIIPKHYSQSYDMKLVLGDLDYVNQMTQEILTNIPEKYSLSQNYPNPFNPITKMDYTLPQRSRVIISIYNVLGKEIKKLVNKEQNYGHYSISWDGTDNKGKEMASGIYFTRMNSKGFNQSKKMLLLK